jgi:hypothetical protein
MTTPLFYNIDYTVGDKLPAKFGRLHVIYRRENPTRIKHDFEILPSRTGQGRFLGCILGIRTLQPNWWGEGEFKVYLDGDTDFPTICGTGTEDYIGQSWGLENVTHLYGGTALRQENLNTIYRWHIKDPIYWKKDVRITIQQIGWSSEVKEKTGSGLYERKDDWSCAAFWYEPVPSAPLPNMPDYADRIADYLTEEETRQATLKPMKLETSIGAAPPALAPTASCKVGPCENAKDTITME